MPTRFFQFASAMLSIIDGQFTWNWILFSTCPFHLFFRHFYMNKAHIFTIIEIKFMKKNCIPNWSWCTGSIEDQVFSIFTLEINSFGKFDSLMTSTIVQGCTQCNRQCYWPGKFEFWMEIILDFNKYNLLGNTIEVYSGSFNHF